jgi:hypothetical protein
MKPKVYLETTIASYLTARTSRDLVVGGSSRVDRGVVEPAPKPVQPVRFRLGS